jgi:hypothetical protein
MNNKEEIHEEDRKSNSSVLNFSLDSTNEKNIELLPLENITNLSDIKKDLLNEVNLPIENETYESKEFILEGREKEISEFFLQKDEKTNNYDQENSKKRSKSNEKKFSLKKPRPILKEPTEYLSPLTLSRKTFGQIPKWNKKPNEVLCDFQKNKIDCKSCNDEDSQDDLFLAYSETERATPSQEDLQNLLNCRKKMIQFKNCINDRTIKEYENILNSDIIFAEKDYNNTKKISFWHKHIRQILRENNNSSLSRRTVGCIVNNKEKDKEDGLFILGILESAANERKGRYTTNI